MLSCLQGNTGGDRDPRWWRKWETIPNTALGKGRLHLTLHWGSGRLHPTLHWGSWRLHLTLHWGSGRLHLTLHCGRGRLGGECLGKLWQNNQAQFKARNIFLWVDLPWLTSLMITNDPSQYCAQSRVDSSWLSSLWITLVNTVPNL